jgi:hypothetical protein
MRIVSSIRYVLSSTPLNNLTLTNSSSNSSFHVHQFVKERLYRIESLQPGTDDYDTILQEIMAHLREHNGNEETKDLPQLEPALGKEGSAEAAQSFKRTKKFVPTR